MHLMKGKERKGKVAWPSCHAMSNETLVPTCEKPSLAQLKFRRGIEVYL